jgi:cation diffusion facilitator CzcD-associated flavoprotein CzcO
MSLAELEARIRRELDYVSYPIRPWVVRREHAGKPVLDVVIIGAGQSGLATAFGLRREAVTNVVVLDRNPAGREGPWLNFARMITLRTPKILTGLDFGMPALTPRAWYEAQWGEDAWQKLDKFPREVWQEYLNWYRRVLDIPVENEFEVLDIASEDGLLVVAGKDRKFVARKVVLATGLDGSGRWNVPAFISRALPAERYAHTADAVDFAALRGKRIGVLGNGASAFDNAAVALEHGAASVDLCLRKPEFPRLNAHKWMEFAGFLGHYWTLPDLERWRFMRQISAMSQPPPQDTFWRCTRFPNFVIRPGAAWTSVALENSAIVAETPKGRFVFDFLICGTGILSDPATRPELARISPHIARWNDVFEPPPGEEDAYLGTTPYLGPGFQFTEKNPGTAPYLKNIHNFTYGATPSMGLSAASISGMKYGLPRLITGIVGDLFRADSAEHFRALQSYSELEITSLDAPPDAGKGKRAAAR